MKEKEQAFFRDNPEGAIAVTVDSREDGLLLGAVEARGGAETWLDYEMDFDPEGETVSLYRPEENMPLVKYRVSGRRVDLFTEPNRLLILWNIGRRALAVDGWPLDPGSAFTRAPEGVTPWLLRLAPWIERIGRT